MSFHRPGPNKRVTAFLIDSLIASGIAILLSLAGIKIEQFIWIAYILFKDCYNGKSIGKFFVDIQIINEEEKPANFVQSIIRNIVMIIPVLPVIEYFIMMNDSLGRRIGDKMAKTRVNDLKPEDNDSFYLMVSVMLAIILIALNVCCRKVITG